MGRCYVARRGYPLGVRRALRAAHRSFGVRQRYLGMVPGVVFVDGLMCAASEAQALCYNIRSQAMVPRRGLGRDALPGRRLYDAL